MVQLLAINLTAKRGNWPRFRARRSNETFKKIEQQILARDNNSCSYCGFISEKYQVVVNRNQDYSPGQSKLDNLATACPFCAQCFFLDEIGHGNNWGGTLVYLPEISQADLNHFCRVLFASMLRDAPYKGKLQTAYLSLKDRENIVNDIFGPKSSDPYTFGQALIDSSLTDDQLKHPIMAQLRLLPEKKCFAQEILYWKSTVFDQIPL
jgi:intracellular multiplication protein IcmJ